MTQVLHAHMNNKTIKKEACLHEYKLKDHERKSYLPYLMRLYEPKITPLSCLGYPEC
jgi:hypothetical protein